MRKVWPLIAALLLAACVATRATHEDATSRAPLAPDPSASREALIQTYAARVVGAKGVFGVHTWIAVKPRDARSYTVYEVIGWRMRWGGSGVVISHRVPDAPWFGAPAELIAEYRGPNTEALIQRIERAANEYPWPTEYSAWPGPNSNTFTAWIARAVPELRIDFPPTAIGKDYLGMNLVGTAPSGSGLQISMGGLLGAAASGVEGVELNVLGLVFGMNPFDFSLKLPIAGRIGPARRFAKDVTGSAQEEGRLVEGAGSSADQGR